MRHLHPDLGQRLSAANQGDDDGRRRARPALRLLGTPIRPHTRRQTNPFLRPSVPSSLRPSRRSASRPAFTLVELIISIGLLGLMMVLAGKVFSLSVESTSQAEALMDVSQSLRLLEDSLRQDLAGVDPDRSLMVIASLPVSAYWTPEDAQGDVDADDPTAGPLNGYPHVADPEREVVGAGINTSTSAPWRLENPRADVLMFFTTRQATSKRFPQIRSNAVQVVYGHAELGKIDAVPPGLWDVQPLAFETNPNLPFWSATGTYRDRFIARNWHLARREVLLVDAAEQDLRNLYGLAPPGFPNLANDPNFDWNNDLSEFNGNAGMSATIETRPLLALSDGELDFVTMQGGPFNFDSLVVQGGVVSIPLALNEFQRWFRRSRLDLSPPPAYQHRMSGYFLPNCASFKVEWTFDDPATPRGNEVIWVDPSDVAGSVVAKLAQRGVRLGIPPRKDFDPRQGGRFDPTTLDFPMTHEFYSGDLVSQDDPDPFFPKALRITVDVYDGGGRFVRPTRHVMVIPVGSQGM